MQIMFDRWLPQFLRRLALLVLGSFVLSHDACVSAPASDSFLVLSPAEVTNAILHNPDMGWVLYENYPVDDSPHGSSTMLTMPEDSFPEADSVALMFSWADIETAENHYDFTKADRAYDFWAARGKAIQLRLSAEPLMLHVPGNPAAGTGVPGWLLNQLPQTARQTRTMESEKYTVVDAREPLYQRRLRNFLQSIHKHFGTTRPVTLIDLRGFGAWGEWHSGFRYPNLPERRNALKTILHIWSESFPDRPLALSYSYDPDGPDSLHAGSTEAFDPSCATNYPDFLNYSAFDEALKIPNITFRRDGCGGSVHSNERKLNEEAFSMYHRVPISGEFLGSYSFVRGGGSNWVAWMVKDALSLHPNYLNFIGWQSGDARAFAKERPDLISQAQREMGYRFVPLRITLPKRLRTGAAWPIEMEWINRGVGMALSDYSFQFCLVPSHGKTVIKSASVPLPTSSWVAGQTYVIKSQVGFPKVPPGTYRLGIIMRDLSSGRVIQLPLKESHPDQGYVLGAFGIR
jgi:hypothetical protein